MKKKNTRKNGFAEWKREVLAFAEDRDWLQFHSPKNLSMAIASESAELMELFLWCESHDSRALPEDTESKERIEEELADVFIFALQMANVADIDLDQAIRRKLRTNSEKYPVEKCRGRSVKYSKL